MIDSFNHRQGRHQQTKTVIKNEIGLDNILRFTNQNGIDYGALPQRSGKPCGCADLQMCRCADMWMQRCADEGICRCEDAKTMGEFDEVRVENE